MSNLVQHAKTELALLYKDGADEMEQEVIDSIIEMVTVFSKVGHSGFTAEWTRGVLNQLLSFQNLTPLTDNPEEWEDVSEQSGEPLWQNKRNSAVFSRDAGKTTYNVNNPTRNETILKPENNSQV